MGGGNHFYDKAPNLIDVEKARINGQKLSEFDEIRLRNQQLRRARRMYLNTLSLSDREPLWRVGPHGVRWEEAGRVPGDTGSGARGSQGFYRFLRFFTDIGQGGLRKLGWDNSRSGIVQFWSGDWKNLAMGRTHWMIKFSAFSVFGTLFLSFYWYINAWQGYLSMHNINHAIRYAPPITYPGDDTITGHMHDLELTAGQNAMDWKHEAKPLPKGSRFDWLTGKVITPDQFATSPYYTRHGMPLEYLSSESRNPDLGKHH